MILLPVWIDDFVYNQADLNSFCFFHPGIKDFIFQILNHIPPPKKKHEYELPKEVLECFMGPKSKVHQL